MDSNSVDKISEIAFRLLNLIKERTNITKQVSDDDLLALHSIFGNVFERALEIHYRKNSVTLYVLENSLRYLIEVKGHSDKLYCLFPDVNYCSCRAFHDCVLRSKTELSCKHILAAYLSELTGTYTKQIVTRDRFNSLYSTSSFLVKTNFDD